MPLLNILENSPKAALSAPAVPQKIAKHMPHCTFESYSSKVLSKS
jgi:hypothetical protein